VSDAPDLGDGDLGGGDFGGLLSQAMEMQQQMMAAQAAVAEAEVEGVAGGGAVRVVVSGAMEFRSVEISPAAVDPDDVEMLQDLVLAALHDAVARVNEVQSQSLGGVGDVLSGSGLGDMLGLGGDALGRGDLDDDLNEGEIDGELDDDDEDDTRGRGA
jgi:DNA-binding YbaB/EbfC family protein